MDNEEKATIDTVNSKEKLVIPENDCDERDIIKRLKDILWDLDYPLSTCCCCGWIDNSSRKWRKCSDCGNTVCWYCYGQEEATMITIQCYECAEE